MYPSLDNAHITSPLNVRYPAHTRQRVMIVPATGSRVAPQQQLVILAAHQTPSTHIDFVHHQH